MSAISAGLSLPSQRAELAVSGRRTPILVQPFPLVFAELEGVLLLPAPLPFALPQPAKINANKMTPVMSVKERCFLLNNFIFECVLSTCAAFATGKPETTT